MKQGALKFHFHNPNGAEKAAQYILEILIKANELKLETAINTEKDRLQAEKETENSESVLSPT